MTDTELFMALVAFLTGAIAGIYFGGWYDDHYMASQARDGQPIEVQGKLYNLVTQDKDARS